MRSNTDDAESALSRPAPAPANEDGRSDDDSNGHRSRLLRLIEFDDSNGGIKFPWRNESPAAVEERRRRREAKRLQDWERFALMREEVERQVAEDAEIRRKRYHEEMDKE